MSLHEYLHEKAEESRHNETLAYLVFLAGAIFFTGGILETITLSQNTEWFFLIPYSAQTGSGSLLGLALIICGVSMTAFGIAAGLNYAHNRGWYMEELTKANSVVEPSKKKIPKPELKKKIVHK
jgi:hypothetical protein